MHLQHYLRPLLAPSSLALVGASERPGSLGRVVYENLLEGEFRGGLFAVNPAHAKVLGRKSFPSISAIRAPVELAVIAVPCARVTGVLEDGAKSGVKAAIVMSAPPTNDGDARRWTRDLAATARRRGIRLLGPHAFGIMRPELGLNASMGTSRPRGGRLALVAQSGSMCTAMLDFALPAGIGFSSVVALGGGIDVGFGELLDALLLDAATDGILLYVEDVRDARRFLSALRAAARTKPVVVLKAGRSQEIRFPAVSGITPPAPDDVFDAAMRRAGAVRVMTYAQLFGVARLLAVGKIARGDRLAIVTNGHAPGTLAADMACDRGIPLARLGNATVKRLASLLPPNIARRNPVNVRGDAPPERLAAAVAASLADDGVDAVLALHVERPVTAPTDAARAVAATARPAAKPVLGAWLGALHRDEVQDALDAGGIASFYTPESAVDAFAYVAAYRRNQQWLLEVAPPQPEPSPPDYVAAERVRLEAAAANRTVLTRLETQRLLGAFGLPVPESAPAETLKEALSAARTLGYPVRLVLDEAGQAPARERVEPVERAGVRNGRMLSRVYGGLFAGGSSGRRAHAHSVIVERDAHIAQSFDVAIGVHTDPVFGPVITFGNSVHAALVDHERMVLLPPLNRRLARDLIVASRAVVTIGADKMLPQLDRLVLILLQLSSLVCAVPWLRTLVLDPVHVGGEDAVIAGMQAIIDPKRRWTPGDYRHMAIHPYPVELVSDLTLADGTLLHVRPIMPEDAELERAFVAGLSEEARYYRFFYRLHELTPAMLARFTQVDYDRELALVALQAAPGGLSFVCVARYIANPDRESAEYAIVVSDAWQGRGVGSAVMKRLIECARTRGLARLEGAVLRANTGMLRFVKSLGFVVREDPAEPDQLLTVLEL